jgi:hypothetical protein
MADSGGGADRRDCRLAFLRETARVRVAPLYLQNFNSGSSF